MSDLPSQLRDLFNSPERIKIFEVVSSFENLFTIKDVVNQLQTKGLNIRITTVQTILKALSYRGYLKQFELKIGNSRGRSTIHYQRYE